VNYQATITHDNVARSKGDISSHWGRRLSAIWSFVNFEPIYTSW